MSQLTAPTRRTKPTPCITPGCRGRVFSVYGDVCNACGQRMTEGLWALLGWTMHGKWVKGSFVPERVIARPRGNGGSH